MPKPKLPDSKTQVLRQRSTLNPNPEKVSDPLFAASDFFDARDLVQVRYEMVRRVRVDGQPSHSAAAFGFSRPTLHLGIELPGEIARPHGSVVGAILGWVPGILVERLRARHSHPQSVGLTLVIVSE